MIEKKTVIESLIALALSSTISIAQTVSTPDDPINGDVNLDGIVDSTDLNTVFVNLSMHTVPGPAGRVTRTDGDLNGDHQITLDDLLLCINATASGNVQTPLPTAPNIALTLQNGILTPVDGYITAFPNLYNTSPSGTQTRILRDFPLINTDTYTHANIDVLSPTIYADWNTDGVDLTVTYTNSTQHPMNAAGIGLPIFDRSTQPSLRDMSRAGNISQLSYNTSSNGFGPLLSYPGALYSPATVLENQGSSYLGDDAYAVGVSVQYPLLEEGYQQTIHMFHRDTSSKDGMQVLIFPNPDNPNDLNVYQHDFEIDAGDTQTFIISLRVRALNDGDADEQNEWMHTLRPYRRWLRGHYGGVQYTRRAEQVNAMSVATSGHYTSSNTYSFTYPNSRRPDLYGFSPWRASWDADAIAGWERLMVYTPTGLYPVPTHTQYNFPPQFTSKWSDILNFVTVGYDNTLTPISGYPAASGGTMGLWAGRSSQIADAWPDSTLEVYDMFNALHTQARDVELDGAIAVNATEIGLDDYFQAGEWEAYWTLIRDQQMYPGVRFITEPLSADFLHTLAPSWDIMTQDTTGSKPLFLMPEGTLIMDFLMPGHETWGKTERRYFPSQNGVPPTDSEVRQYIQEVADLGFVPCFFGTKIPENFPKEFDSAKTWLTTVPAMLQ